jgi:hypothetical protein
MSSQQQRGKRNGKRDGKRGRDDEHEQYENARPQKQHHVDADVIDLTDGDSEQQRPARAAVPVPAAAAAAVPAAVPAAPAVHVPAPPGPDEIKHQSPEGRAQLMERMVDGERNKFLSILVGAQLGPATASEALASLSDHVKALKAEFAKRRQALIHPRPDIRAPVKAVKVYEQMTAAQWRALPRWEQLYAYSCRRFVEMIGQLEQLCRRLSDQVAGGWTPEQRRHDVVYDLGEWLDQQDEQHKALPQDQQRRDDALKTFEAGFAIFEQGLEPLQPSAAPLPEWVSVYRRLKQRFADMCGALRSPVDEPMLP